MATRTGALNRKEVEAVGRLFLQEAEILCARTRGRDEGRGNAMGDAMGTGIYEVLRGFEIEDQRRKDQVRKLLMRHLRARFVARNGGWRPLKPHSPLARELQLAAKKSRILQRAQRAMRRAAA